jgi:hypothetical protein
MSETWVFTHEIRWEPAYDKSSADPKKNYGIGSMQIRFLVFGERTDGLRGAVQVLVNTGWYLPHLVDKMLDIEVSWHVRYPHGGPLHLGLKAWDVGYNSPVRLRDWQEEPTFADCDVLGGPCYYDGSSLQAKDFMLPFLRGGPNAIWPLLEERFHDWFDGVPKDGVAFRRVPR